ncbi:hypothetical protein DGG96_03560 [Legionella qingyii]|uniref:Uncharacterized protein n=1 Tax=Legionella qingyii TaxID=2184757 RepID=A0A317U6Y0_9GAMM|nr:hypothetical protein DGG96_03560 [Legionella qingyii]
MIFVKVNFSPQDFIEHERLKRYVILNGEVLISLVRCLVHVNKAIADRSYLPVFGYDQAELIAQGNRRNLSVIGLLGMKDYFLFVVRNDNLLLEHKPVPLFHRKGGLGILKAIHRVWLDLVRKRGSKEVLLAQH